MKLFGPAYPTLRRVIVNLKTGKAFRGVLWQRTREYLLLRQAELLREHEAALGLDGEVLIYSAEVEFMQVVR